MYNMGGKWSTQSEPFLNVYLPPVRADWPDSEFEFSSSPKFGKIAIECDQSSRISQTREIRFFLKKPDFFSKPVKLENLQ